jgi:hypothetical protein
MLTDTSERQARSLDTPPYARTTVRASKTDQQNWVVETASGNLNLPFTAIPDEPLINPYDCSVSASEA